jgi:hypothetical protein
MSLKYYITSKTLLKLCGVDFPKNPEYEYEDIEFPDGYTKPTKEVFEAKFQEILREYSFKELRQERNRRLAEVDWIFTSDYDLSVSDHAMWMAYRKALRDLPSTTEDPANPVWPEKPPLPKGETFSKNVTGEIEAVSRVVTVNEAVRNENIRLRSKITSLEHKTTSLEFTLLELKNRVSELET